MGAREGDFVLHDGFWGPSQICKTSGLLWGPSGLGPERGLRGGPPSRMFSTARYVWNQPRASCCHGNKTGAVAAAGARLGWGVKTLNQSDQALGAKSSVRVPPQCLPEES